MLDQRGLARAVLTHKTEDTPLANFKAHVVESQLAAVTVRETTDLDNGIHTLRSFFLRRIAAQRLVALSQQRDEPIFVVAEIDTLHDQRVRPFREDPPAFGIRVRRHFGRDISPRAAFLVDQARQLQFTVGPHHRVRVQYQLLRQDPDRRQLAVGLETARRDQRFDLPHKLQINRDAVTLANSQMKHDGVLEKRWIESVYRNSDTI